MASLNILCFNPFNLKIEHNKIFRGPSKILQKCFMTHQNMPKILKYFMATTKILLGKNMGWKKTIDHRSSQPKETLFFHDLIFPFLFFIYSLQMYHNESKT